MTSAARRAPQQDVEHGIARGTEPSMTRGVDRIGLVALVGSGTFAAHELGYLTDDAATDAAGVSHAYLGVLGPVILLAACVSAWVAAVRVLRNDPGRLPSPGSLAVAQVAVYAVVEVVERLVGGSLGSLGSAPVVLGLLAQPVVAWAALQLLRLGRDVVARFRDATVSPSYPTLADTPTPAAVYASSASFPRLRVRGPPI